VAGLLAGCGTLAQFGQADGPAAFGGFRTDVKSIYQTPGETESFAEAATWLAALVLDLPFSLVADTLVLPYSVFNEIRCGGATVDSWWEMLFANWRVAEPTDFWGGIGVSIALASPAMAPMLALLIVAPLAAARAAAAEPDGLPGPEPAE